MMATVDADTITDAQIRELGGPGCDRAIRRVCKVALNDAPTYLKAATVRDARARCAEIWNKLQLTRAPLPPPFPIGTTVRYLGREEISTSFDAGPGTLVKYHGMVVTISRVVQGRRGTGQQLHDDDGPMFYEDDGKPILDYTRDGHSVYVLVDAKKREHGRAIQRDSMHEWEVVKP